MTEEFPVPDNATIEAAATLETDEEYAGNYVELPPNLAGNAKLVKQFHALAHKHYQRQEDQPQRRELLDMMRSADAMYRAGKRRDRTVQGATQQQDTLSNVASVKFYRSIKVITATQTAALLPTEGLPAKYEPRLDGEDYADAEGQRIAEGRNLLLRYTWDTDDWEQKLRKSFLYNNKYAQELVMLEWSRVTKKKVCRRPGYYSASGEPVEAEPGETPAEPMFTHDGKPLERLWDDTGRPLSYVFVEKTLVVKDCPWLYRHDLKDVSLDWTVDDLQQQSVVVLRCQKTLDELFALQRDSEFINLGKLSGAQLFAGEDKNAVSQGEPLRDRQDNKGEAYESEKNGLFDVYRVWMRAPIDDGYKRGKTDKTRGKWDTEKAIPVWFEAYFVGPFGQLAEDGEKSKPGGCVCVCLRRNPYHHGEFPGLLLHTHDDDAGAVHMGYQTLAECLYEEETATINELFDNKTMRTYSPWVAEKGNVLSRDLKFKHGNQVLWVKPGTGQTALTKLDVPDTTGTALPTLAWLDEEFNKTLGTDKPITGEFAGSRTTGTEYLGVREQATQPVVEDLRYIAGQLYPWLLRVTADLWEQFGDPEKKIKIQDGVVAPTELYGEYKVRVVAIDAFVTDLARKQVLLGVVQSGAYDKAAPFMGKNGALLFWKDFFRAQKFPGSYKYFPVTRSKEAENQAWSDVAHIMSDPAGALQTGLPQEGEQHDIHLNILETMRDRYITATPQDEQNPAVLRAFETYILLHKQMQEAEQAATNVQAAGAEMMAGAAGGGMMAQGMPGQAVAEGAGTPPGGAPPGMAV